MKHFYFLTLFFSLISGIMFSQIASPNPNTILENSEPVSDIQVFGVADDINANRSSCDDMIETIDDGFESYNAGSGEPMPTCWTLAGAFSLGGVRNTADGANSGNNYVLGYSFSSPSGYAYIITPKLSTINGNYAANFSIKGMGSTGSAINFEYGTMSSNTDLDSFTAFGTVQAATSSYVEHTTPEAPNSSDTYFALRFQITEQHSAVYLDDFKWMTSDTFSVNSLDKEIGFKVYPNPAKGSFITIDINEFSQEKVGLVVYDASGKAVLMKKDISNGNNTINISMLSKGLYFLELQSNTKRGYKKVIIE